MRGADIIARGLAEAGIDRLFSLSGNQIMPVYDACIDAGVDIVHVRHEAAAVHMADAWARLGDGVGVALVTAGPGHANGVSALYTALMSESPVLYLSGHSPLDRADQGPFQEMEQARMAAPVCKATWTARDAGSLGGLLATALATAQAPPRGPVHVSLPFDVLQAPAAATPPAPAAGPCLAAAADAELAEMARLLGAGVRPLILAGPGFALARARPTLEALGAAGGVPTLVLESPRGVNDPALGAFAQVLARADRILLLGKALDFALRFGETPAVSPGCRFLQIQADATAYARAQAMLGERMLCGAHADPTLSAPALAQALRAAGRRHDPWLREVSTAVAYRPPEWQTIRADGERGVHPVAVCRALQRLLDGHGNGALVCDGGEFGQWVQASVSAPHRLINGPAGAIGAALPFAAAAKLAMPSSAVVAALGDGTMGFHLAEFETALRARTPYVAVVGNDARWNAEHQIQLRDYGPERLIGCDLSQTRYDRVVEAMGGHGEHVAEAAALDDALARALASGRPACVNVRLDGQPAPVVRRG